MAILTTLPGDANVLDIQAERAARAEVRAAAGKGNSYVKLAAGYVAIKPELPIDLAIRLQDEDLKGALMGLLADPDDVDALLADGLSAEDLSAILTFITGKSLGE